MTTRPRLSGWSRASDRRGDMTTTQQRQVRQPSWQSVDSGQLLLVAAAGMLVVAAVAHTAAVGLTQARDAVAFGALIAFGQLLRLSLPGDREAAPIGSAGALGYALVLQIGLAQAHQSAMQVVAVTAAGLIVAGWFAECVIRALIRADALRAKFKVTLVDEVRVQWQLGAAVGASAM